MTSTFNQQDILNLLKQIPDPEIPVINIIELGVVRTVAFENDTWVITITPTYSGCPAMHAIETDIAAVMMENGIYNFKLKTVLSPAWTTDWMSDASKEKLRAYGIAPPNMSTEQLLTTVLSGKKNPTACPFCKSANTALTSSFGSTACKALHYCNNCHQPFEEFKCH